MSSYNAYTVSSLTGELKAAIEPRFAKVYLEAEISGWRLYPSGHAYFTLKDSGAQIAAVMFASALERCQARGSLKDGAKVVVYGNVSVYAPRGNYQFVVLAAKLAGVGELMQRYLALKAKLTAEGLFDSARKRPLPSLPRRIGIVTSEAGAVIHDMCTVMTRRFPNLEIRLYPCLVQGEAAPATIIAGIRHFNAAPADGWRADLLIVARGGGSFEDLFCFNDETLVRALAASEIPTVSAVGHETDYTLCDFAADVRAGTPSIAAEIAVPVKAELDASLKALNERLVAALRAKGEWFAQRLDQLAETLSASLTLAASRGETRLLRARTRLEAASRLALTRAESRLREAAKSLALLSPYGVLERGYALVTDAAGAVVKDAAALAAGDALSVRLAKGRATAVVAEKVER